MDIKEICEMLWPEILISGSDVDNMPFVATSLSEMTDTKLDLVTKSTYGIHEVKWLMPTNKIHRNRKSYGLMVCSRCLRGDIEMLYFKKPWRLAVSFLCVKCGIGLIDRCPKCLLPINVFTCSMSVKHGSLLCPCGFAFSNYNSLLVKDSVFELQLKVNEILSEESITTKMFYYREGIELFTSIFTSRDWNAMDLAKAVANEMLLDIPRLCDRYGFNSIDIAKREMVLKMSDWIMVDWPLRYFYICNKYKLPQRAIVNCFPAIGRLLHL